MPVEPTLTRSVRLYQWLYAAARWCWGHPWPRPTPTYDTLEPYSTEQRMQQGFVPYPPVSRGEARAIRKIGARYGVEL